MRWGPSWFVRVASLALLAGWILVLPYAAIQSVSNYGSSKLWGVLAFGVVLVGPVAFVIWRYGPRNYAEAREGGLFVRNPWHDYLVPWTEIIGATPTYFGVAVQRRQGKPIVIWSVQKTNIAAWTGTHTRADDMALYLLGRAADPGQARRT
jgi:hypothetical protein